MIFSENFIKSSSECFHEFSFIVGQTLKNPSALHETFERTTQEFRESWFFIKRKSLETEKKQLARTCFLFYSSEWGEKSKMIQMMQSYLESCLNEKGLFRYFCVLLKIAFVKMNLNDFQLIWNRFVRKIVVLCLQVFEDPDDFSAVLDCLRLIEFFFCVEFEEISRILYLFLPDLNGKRTEGNFEPVLLKRFFKDPERVKSLDECNFDLKVCKSFVTGFEDVDNFNDLEKIVVSFVIVWKIHSIQPPGHSVSDVFEQIERELQSLFINI
jgi:hypothetical protein